MTRVTESIPWSIVPLAMFLQCDLNIFSNKVRGTDLYKDESNQAEDESLICPQVNGSLERDQWRT